MPSRSRSRSRSRRSTSRSPRVNIGALENKMFVALRQFNGHFEKAMQALASSPSTALNHVTAAKKALVDAESAYSTLKPISFVSKDIVSLYERALTQISELNKLGAEASKMVAVQVQAQLSPATPTLFDEDPYNPQIDGLGRFGGRRRRCCRRRR